MASAFQAQLMSLVAEGAFDRFPTLRVICVESGFAWLPSLMWRFDRLWRGLRREIPWTRRPPSAYLREHVRLTTQPFDAPSDPAGFARVVDQIGSRRAALLRDRLPALAGGQRRRGSAAARRERRTACDHGRERPQAVPAGRCDVSERNSDARRRQEPLIDCDVHNALPDDDALRPYLPAVWRDRREGLTYLPTEFRQVRENLGDRSYIGAPSTRAPHRAPRASTRGRRVAGRRPPISPSRSSSCSTRGTSRRRS